MCATLLVVGTLAVPSCFRCRYWYLGGMREASRGMLLMRVLPRAPRRGGGHDHGSVDKSGKGLVVLDITMHEHAGCRRP